MYADVPKAVVGLLHLEGHGLSGNGLKRDVHITTKLGGCKIPRASAGHFDADLGECTEIRGQTVERKEGTIPGAMSSQSVHDE